MSDAIGALAASAALAQGLLGEPGGLATRLHAALSHELARARADVAFAASAAATGVALRAAGERAGALGPETVGVLARGAEGAVDARTRATAEGLARAHRAGTGDRDGRGGGVGDDADGRRGAPGPAPAVTTPLAAADLAAVERALAAAQDASEAAGVTGRLRALVLPGEALRGAPADRWDDGAGRGCELLILCTAFDGELGAGRRVWGYGYLDARLRAALDARRGDDVGHAPFGGPGSTPVVWSVSTDPPSVGGLPRATCAHGRDRFDGPLLPRETGPGEAAPERWSIELHEAPTWL